MKHICQNTYISIASAVTEYLSVFLIGAAIYFFIEILWRGYSHITMFFAGGLCLSLIYFLEKHIYETKLIYRCLIYALCITAVEFVFGVIFNIVLKFNVWDYSDMSFNILGQVCPQFFVLWTIIAYPAIKICGVFRNLFSGY